MSTFSECRRAVEALAEGHSLDWGSKRIHKAAEYVYSFQRFSTDDEADLKAVSARILGIYSDDTAREAIRRIRRAA